MVLYSWPSLALENGAFPVLSNGNGSPVWKFTPAGWYVLPDLSGYIAGDGKATLVCNGQPVRYGRDGQFYSVAFPFPVRYSPSGTWDSVGPAFPFSANRSACTADPSGWVYMVGDNFLGMTRGTDWQIVPLPLWGMDVAISPFGDVAVAGILPVPGGTPVGGVAWFDYPSGTWKTRAFEQVVGRVGVEFDQKGNLGVAYVNPAKELRFAYLDYGQDLWTDERVAQLSVTTGAVLAFDGQDKPVVAAGNVVAYEPQPVITGSVTFQYFVGDPTGYPAVIEFQPKDPLGTYARFETLLDGNGRFFVPNTIVPADYRVTVKVTHWMRAALANVQMVPGNMTLPNIGLFNGDYDEDNEVTVFDINMILLAFGGIEGEPGWDPKADMDGDGEITVFDVNIVLLNFGMIGDE